MTDSNNTSSATDNADIVAARIREKIRLQALDLLLKADTVERSRRINRTVSGMSSSIDGTTNTNSNANNNSTTSTPIVSRSPSTLNIRTLNNSAANLSPLDTNNNNYITENDIEYNELLAMRTSLLSNSNSNNVKVNGLDPLLITTDPLSVDDETTQQQQQLYNNNQQQQQQQQQQTPSSSSQQSNSIVTPSSSNELTKRLQKLALERQKLYSDNNNQRLKVIQSNTSSHLVGVKNFTDLQLPSYLLDAIYTMGFDRPSAIQEEALPRILAGRNIIGQAQSGSGKTAAFTIGMLVRIIIDEPATCQAICVTPTRELAIQIVDKAITPMACNMNGLKVQLAISQSTINNTNKKNKGGVQAHIVVGTPGKIVDWLKRKLINVSNCKVFVLDEADHMVIEDGGHRANSIVIKKSLPPTCQSLLFSATFPQDVITFASKMILLNNNNNGNNDNNNAKSIEDNTDKILIEDGKPEYLVLDVIKQLYVDTRTYNNSNNTNESNTSNATTTKVEFLAEIYSLLTIGQSIVFVDRKDEADLVHETLTNSGYTCSILHSRVDATQRDITMNNFRNGLSNVLITTNVLARGVDVDNVCLVINYDVPLDKDNLYPAYETYLHRIGRTGRFGRKGTAITLIHDDISLQHLKTIQQHFMGTTSTSTSTNGNTSKVDMIQQAPADPEKLAEMIEI